MEICDLDLFSAPSPEGGASPSATLLSIVATNGHRGWSELPDGWPEEQFPDRARELLAVLAGRRVHDVVEIVGAQLANDPAVACAVEIALWDLIGKSANQPLCNLWGGAYRTHIPLAVCIEAAQLSTGQQQVMELRESGHHHFVLRCSGDLDADALAIHDLQRLTGPSCQVAVDGQALYSTTEALRLCDMLPEGGVRELIDPVADGDIATTCSLARLCGIPLAISSAIKRQRDIVALIRDLGIRGVYIDPYKVGGLLAAQRCLVVASAGGLTASLHMAGVGDVALAAMLHMAASMPQLDHPHLYVPAGPPQVQSAQGLAFADGTAVVPRGVGLGVDVVV